MKTLEKGGEKIQKICEALRTETLEPAKGDAKKIVEDAQAERERIIRQAEQEAKALIAQARKQVEQERRVFDTSLSQAAKQGIESFKQNIEHQLFNQQLAEMIEKSSATPKVVASLLEAIVTALKTDGLDADLEGVVAKNVNPAEVNALLAQGILEKLKSGVRVGDFAGGAQVRVKDKKITIDISDQALGELLSGYLREDFRKLFFA
ncbi:MAG: V-type ATP synthase subunit E [Chlamydiales bacterium]|nr:V-type ATP synthase subunit E [Chlamydiales bacterium]